MKKAKERKGAVVKKLENTKTERVNVIRLDKSDMTFFARDPDEEETPENRGTIERIESKDYAAVETWLEKRLTKRLTPVKDLDWKRIIHVRIEEGGDRGYGWRTRRDKDEERNTSVSANIDRYCLGLSHDRKDWFKLEWHQLDEKSSTFVEPEDRLATARHYAHGPKYVDPAAGNWGHTRDPDIFTIPHYDSGRSVVPYTEELWLGLNQVFDNLDATTKTIEKMLGTKKGLVLLAGEGKKLLAAGTPVSEETIDAEIEEPT